MCGRGLRARILTRVLASRPCVLSSPHLLRRLFSEEMALVEMHYTLWKRERERETGRDRALLRFEMRRKLTSDGGEEERERSLRRT